MNLFWIKKRKVKKVKEKKDPNILPEIAALPKAFLRLATSLKQVGIPQPHTEEQAKGEQ